MERVLDVALADDAEPPHDLERSLAQQEVLAVRQRLRRRNDDRVARVHAERVEVLHVAHGETVVLAVAHDLVLDLLPAAQVLVDQNLRRDGERLLDKRH